VVYTPGSPFSVTVGRSILVGAAAIPGTDSALWVPAGRGALVGFVQHSNTTWYLVCGMWRYQLASSSVAERLGYNIKASGTALPTQIGTLFIQLFKKGEELK
jgi:hypothetical protein